MWVRLFRLVQWLTMSCIFSPASFPRVCVCLLVALHNARISFGDISHILFSVRLDAQIFCHDMLTGASVP